MAIIDTTFVDSHTTISWVRNTDVWLFNSEHVAANERAEERDYWTKVIHGLQKYQK